MSLREVGANRQPVIRNTANHQPEAGSGEGGGNRKRSCKARRQKEHAEGTKEATRRRSLGLHQLLQGTE